MKFEQVPTEYYVKVYPKEPFWRKNYTVKENLNICEDIKSDIERHVDDIGQVFVEGECFYKLNGREYNTIYEGLVGEFDEVGVDPYYSVCFNKTENEHAMQNYYNNFEELTMQFYDRPQYFERVNWNEVDNITKEQIDFLRKVVEFRNKADD